jgi:hypothetical protein
MKLFSIAALATIFSVVAAAPVADADRMLPPVINVVYFIC